MSGFRWEDLGVDDGGLPVHLPMGLTVDNQGPEGDSTALVAVLLIVKLVLVFA